MSKKVFVMTPHPDDETLGCGGTLLKYKDNGDLIYWIILTKMSDEYSEERRLKRSIEIKKVSQQYNFDGVYQLPFDTATLDGISLGTIIGEISDIFNREKPNVVLTPYPGDIHSDHKIVFDATMACCKTFRYPSVEKIMVYETLSETDFSINPDLNSFRPNVFINIEKFIEKKIEIMKIYQSEILPYPFPRSEKTIRALASLRGSSSGYMAAEAFMLLKERVE